MAFFIKLIKSLKILPVNISLPPLYFGRGAILRNLNEKSLVRFYLILQEVSASLRRSKAGRVERPTGEGACVCLFISNVNLAKDSNHLIFQIPKLPFLTTNLKKCIFILAKTKLHMEKLTLSSLGTRNL